MKQATPLKRHLRESPDLQKLRHKRKMLRMRTLTLVSIFFVVLCSGFIYFARYPKMQIKRVTVSGNQITETRDIEKHVNKYIEGKYAYVIPHRNSYLYPKKKITADILESFPRVQSVYVYRTSLDTLHIEMTEVRAIALWCGVSTEVIDTNVPCYFTNEAGKIVAVAPYYSGNVFPRFFGSNILTDSIEPLGNNFATAEDFRKLFIFSEEVKEYGFEIKAIRIGPAKENAFILDLGKDKTAIIRFLADDDYHIISANLSAAVSKSELQNQLKKNKINLMYFDLRFKNKVYYKFADSPTPVVPTTKTVKAKTQ
ncbi:MAG: FtsQ-type POTRA domain-containing protein [Candidatus Pacebacteria bacterium]|nr:FtsQ-type POTRA domain-containing protein [Candidatus Paceibacterota bacterium]